MHNLFYSNFRAVSVMVARPGDTMWVNKLVDESVQEFANVTREGNVLTRVDFVVNTIFSVTGLHAEGKACTNLHFARENRGRDAGQIRCGEMRFWPKLRAAVHKMGADLIETVSAIGGLDYVLTFADEWLLPEFGREFNGNLGRIINEDHIGRILNVLEPEKAEEEDANDLLATLEKLGQKYGVTTLAPTNEATEQEIADTVKAMNDLAADFDFSSLEPLDKERLLSTKVVDGLQVIQDVQKEIESVFGPLGF